jgi:hypothetical protein
MVPLAGTAIPAILSNWSSGRIQIMFCILRDGYPFRVESEPALK